MSDKLSLYFGALGQPGHFLQERHRRLYADCPPRFPWNIGHLDNGLLKNGKHPDVVDGQVFWTCGGRDAFWYAFFWWDRSCDHRGNSNSGFYVTGFGGVEAFANGNTNGAAQEAFNYACDVWPDVVERQTVPLRLVLKDSYTMPNLVIVNASSVLSDTQIQAKLPALQLSYDRDFAPLWRGRVPAGVRYVFAPASAIARLDPADMVIFINKHSADPGALGWHDFEAGKVFSRVYAGDCLRFGLDWGVTLDHEAKELLADPDIKRVYRMPDGRLAAFENCDPVEADEQAYEVLPGHKMSNFVFPDYFSTNQTGQYDFRGFLKAPCPALTHGGYLPVTDRNDVWTQVQMDHRDGLAGRRAIMQGHRRQRRSQRTLAELEEVSFP